MVLFHWCCSISMKMILYCYTDISHSTLAHRNIISIQLQNETIRLIFHVNNPLNRFASHFSPVIDSTTLRNRVIETYWKKIEHRFGYFRKYEKIRTRATFRQCVLSRKRSAQRFHISTGHITDLENIFEKNFDKNYNNYNKKKCEK